MRAHRTGTAKLPLLAGPRGWQWAGRFGAIDEMIDTRAVSLAYLKHRSVNMCLLAEFGDRAFWEVIITSVVCYYVFFYWGDPLCR